MKKHSKEQIEGTADAIKSHFIPKDPTIKTFTFHFTIPPSSNYKVRYEQDDKGNWLLSEYEIAET